MDIKYTLCFCIYDDEILLIKRIKEPNADMWNGLGGKIEPGEMPYESVKREMLEEAELDIELNAKPEYHGIVSWSYLPDADFKMGMHLFTVNLKNKLTLAKDNQMTDEGLLGWHKLDWACDKNNSLIVSNIPLFLTHALNTDGVHNYHFLYEGDDIKDLIIDKQ